MKMRLLSITICLVVFLSACGRNVPSPTPSLSVKEPTRTVAVTATPHLPQPTTDRARGPVSKATRTTPANPVEPQPTTIAPMAPSAGPVIAAVETPQLFMNEPVPTPADEKHLSGEALLTGKAQTYRNTQLGFAIDYPEGWTLIDVNPEIMASGQPYTATLLSPQPAGGGSELAAGASKMDITIIPGGAASLDAAAAQQRAAIEGASPPGQITAENRLTLAANLPALRWEITSPGSASVLFIAVINGNVVLLNGIGDKELFDVMVLTLRPLHP